MSRQTSKNTALDALADFVKLTQDDGNYYEASQRLDALAKRLKKIARAEKDVTTRQQTLEPVLKLLHKNTLFMFGAGPKSMEEANKLAQLELDLYKVAEYSSVDDAESEDIKASLLEVLSAFPPDEPPKRYKQKFADQLLEWMHDDQGLHHAVGKIFAADDNTEQAERHFLQGNQQSPVALSTMLFEWYTENDERSTAPHYIARAVVPYLAVGKVSEATAAYMFFTTKLSQRYDAKALPVQELAMGFQFYPLLPLLNFLGLLLQLLQRGTPAMYANLQSRYADDLRGVSWDDLLREIGYRNFGVARPREPSRGMDPMSMAMNMLSGGGFGGRR